MENTNYAIEIDGEAICLDNDGDTVVEEPEQTEEVTQMQSTMIEDTSLKDTDRSPDKLQVVMSSKELSEELLGQVVYSEEEAYKLYCEYGLRMGFSIRKGKQYYFTGTKNIRTKDYYCSKEGSRDEDPDADPSRPDARTNCKAMIRFRVDNQGRWKVIRLVQEHNHELVRPGQRHMLRSARSLMMTKPAILEKMVAAIQPIPPRCVTNEETGMGASVGPLSDTEIVTQDLTEQDGSEEKVTLIEPADAQGVINYFKQRLMGEGMFYRDVQVDSEGRMTNLFFHDGRSYIDYDCFGDVVVFDTTYRINKYNMVCAPFLGVNHHWQNVMFGCAFLLDESIESYEWLFRSFVESMGGHAPKSLFTDQNPAAAKAIENVLPDTCHCLCQWHVLKNMESHLGISNMSRTFQTLFTKCMKSCESEIDFEDTWGMMVREYSVQDHSWLNELYEVRQKWCSVLHKDAYDGGITSIEKAESLSNVFNGISDESTSLIDFLIRLDKLVASWRQSEVEEDYRCSQSVPPRVIKNSSLLNKAAELYTHKAYKLFEADFLDGNNATSYQETQCGGSLYRFQFMAQARGSKVWIVLLDTSTMEVTCSCKKFETMGLLCPHSLNALNLKSVDRIPDRYMLNRWTKDARRRVYGIGREQLSNSMAHLEGSMAEMVYRNQAMKYVYNLLLKSCDNEEMKKILWDALESGEESLETAFEIKGLLPYASMRNKESEKNDKKKKKMLKEDKKSKKAKKTLIPSSQDPVYVAVSNDTQPYSAPDPRINQPAITGSRPMFVQGYATNDVSSGQMYMHPNMNNIPHCSSQDYSSYGGIRPPLPSNFGSRNM
ncbi:protein FAR1-RELATED SEQUENCE 9-like isoform X2 [Carex rostrata]